MPVLALLTLVVIIIAFIDAITRREDQVKHMPKFVWVFFIVLLRPHRVGPVVHAWARVRPTHRTHDLQRTPPMAQRHTARPGLTAEQRFLGSRAWPGLNLRMVVMRDTSVDGVRIPDIVHGIVLSPSDEATPVVWRGTPVQWIPAPLVCECASCVATAALAAAGLDVDMPPAHPDATTAD